MGFSRIEHALLIKWIALAGVGVLIAVGGWSATANTVPVQEGLHGQTMVEGWVMGNDCGTYPSEAAYRERLHALEVDDSEYLPRPFPSTSGDLVEDFEYEFRRRWVKNPKKQRVAVALRRGDVTYEVRAITNWSGSRCSSFGRLFRNRENYLVRLFHSRDKSEIARARMNADGKVGVFGVGPFDGSVLLSVDEGRTLARIGLAEERKGTSASGRYLERGQLVKSHGSMACLDLQPCVAFKSELGVVLVERSRFGLRVGLEAASGGLLAELDARQIGEMVRSGNQRGVAIQTTGASITEFRVLLARTAERN